MATDHPTADEHATHTRHLEQENHLVLMERDGLREALEHTRSAMAGLAKAYGAQSQNMELVIERFRTFEGVMSKMTAKVADLEARGDREQTRGDRLQADVERLQAERTEGWARA